MVEASEVEDMAMVAGEVPQVVEAVMDMDQGLVEEDLEEVDLGVDLEGVEVVGWEGDVRELKWMRDIGDGENLTQYSLKRLPEYRSDDSICSETFGVLRNQKLGRSREALFNGESRDNSYKITHNLFNCSVLNRVSIILSNRRSGQVYCIT